MLLLYIVQKSFQAEGQQRPVGEIVNATTWRTRQQMIDQRYLVPLHPSEDVTDCSCHRQWSNEASFVKHQEIFGCRSGASAERRPVGRPRSAVAAG